MISYDARSSYRGEAASRYDEFRRSTAYRRWVWNREARALRRVLRLIGPDSILDLPVGTARLAPSMRAFGYVVGADISRDMLAEARSSCPGLPLVLCEGESLPFKEGAFDIVVSIRLFQHLPEATAERILGEMMRVSVSGALVQAPVKNVLSPVILWTRDLILWAQSGFRGRRPLSKKPKRTFFPAPLAAVNRLLARNRWAIRGSHVVTWRGGQLRLLHIVERHAGLTA